MRMNGRRPRVSPDALSFKVTPACWSVWASLQPHPARGKSPTSTRYRKPAWTICTYDANQRSLGLVPQAEAEGRPAPEDFLISASLRGNGSKKKYFPPAAPPSERRGAAWGQKSPVGTSAIRHPFT